MRHFNSIFWPALSGVLVALLWLKFYPVAGSYNTPKVEFKEISTTTTATNALSYADAVEIAAPAVVNIYTRTLIEQPEKSALLQNSVSNTDNIPNVKPDLGSGVILSEQGYIVTNHHVVSNADSIVVALKDGREALAEVIGTDIETDLAVLKISLPKLPSITLRTTKPRVGDVVLAIGNPFGVGQTVTMGIISATGRNRLGLSTYEDFIQTDAAINPGNSGGALIDIHGNLVGISSALFSKSGGSQGIGFAIPSDLTKQVMQDLIKQGRVIRGWLGIEARVIPAGVAESFGLSKTESLIIAGIYRNSPAHKAGLQPGDAILSIDNHKITDGIKSMNRIAHYKPGKTVAITVLRNNEKLTFSATITERPVSK